MHSPAELSAHELHWRAASAGPGSAPAVGCRFAGVRGVSHQPEFGSCPL